MWRDAWLTPGQNRLLRMFALHSFWIYGQATAWNSCHFYKTDQIRHFVRHTRQEKKLSWIVSLNNPIATSPKTFKTGARAHNRNQWMLWATHKCNYGIAIFIACKMSSIESSNTDRFSVWNRCVAFKSFDSWEDGKTWMFHVMCYSSYTI